MKTDWETINPHPMSNEATRLAVMEKQVETMEDNQKVIFKKLDSIQRVQWMIGGAMVLLEVIFKHQ